MRSRRAWFGGDRPFRGGQFGESPAVGRNGNGTTWFFKVFGFIFSMDKMVGKDFEKGLAKLKALAEAG